MKNTINLSAKEHSMSAIILTNHSTLDTCKTNSELLTTLKTIFSENNLDTPASRRLIQNVAKQKSLTGGLQTIYNSFLCGSGLSVI